MSTKYYCSNKICTHPDNGPFVIELAQEAVMDGNNLATIFCPRCSKPMKELPSDHKKSTCSHRFYCYNDTCGSNEMGLFFIDLPSEAIMDPNNQATIFCPKCAKEMKPLCQELGTAVNF